MIDKRSIKQDACHATQGPHMELPSGFVPLRLLTEDEQVHIEVGRPTVVVGRHSEAELRLSFADVSRRHCRLAFEAGKWRVYDLKSMNGVFLNGEQVTEATLYAGDRLRIGGVLLHVEVATPVRILKPSNEPLTEKLIIAPAQESTLRAS